MADDANKSDKPVNGKVPKHLRDVFGQRDYNVDYAHLVTKQSAATIKERLDAVEDLKGLATTPAMRNTIDENLTYVQGELDTEIDRLEGIHAPKYNENLASSIETYTKHRNVNSRTTTLSGKARFGRAAAASSDRYLPTEHLENRNRILTEEQGQLGELMAGQARDMAAGDSSKDLLGKSASRVGAIDEEIAFNKRLMKTQSRQGLSTEKLINRGEDLDAAVGDFLEKKGVEQKVDSGNVKSYEQEAKVMGHMRSNRNKLQEQYNDAIEDGSAMAGTFAEKLSKANDALDNQTRVVKRMSEKGMDKAENEGMFGGGRGQMLLQGAGFLGGALANGARNTKQITVDHDIAQMNNRAAFAAQGNQIYGKAEKAMMNNDVDAAFDVLSTPAFAKKFADTNRKITHGAAWTAAAGNGVANVAGGVGKGAAIGAGVGLALAGVAGFFSAGTALPAAPAIVAGSTKAGAWIGGLSALSDSANEVSNIAHGNVGADSSLRSIAAVQNLSREARKIKTYQMQKYYNQNLNTYSSGMGLGNSQAAGMQGALTDVDTLKELGNAGVGAEQAAQMSGMLKQAGQFGGAKNGIAMIRSAGEAGQRGIMGREDYMHAATRMVAAGAGNDDMQDAITKGLENAKNINQMVDASVGLSAGLAAQGVSGAGAASKMLSASFQDLTKLGVNENLAIGTAASDITNLDNKFRSKGMSFGNLMERAALRQTKGLGDASVHQMNNLAEMSLTDIATLREGGKEGKLLARRKGITNLIYNQDGSVKDGVMDSVGAAALKASIVDVGGVEQANDIVRRSKVGEALTEKQRAVMNQVGSSESGAARVFNSNAEAKGDKKFKELNGSEAEKKKAKWEVDQLASGKKFAEDMGGEKGDAYKKIEELFDSVADAIKPEEFSKNIAKGAADFEMTVVNAGEKFAGKIDTILNQHAALLKRMDEGRAPTVDQKIPSKTKKD